MIDTVAHVTLLQNKMVKVEILHSTLLHLRVLQRLM